MNPTEKFHANFASIVNGALSEGVELGTIILTLDATKFELQLALLELNKRKAQAALAHSIIPSTHLPKLPPLNGRG